MSRIGKQSVLIPGGVTAEVNGQDLSVKGPKGELSLTLHPHATVKEEKTEDEKAVLVVNVQDQKEDSAIWGTMRALVANMVHGVSEGWTKSLELNGVGFKMNVKGKTIVMALGFSHEVRYEIPDGITVTIDGAVMTITGPSRELVGKRVRIRCPGTPQCGRP